MGGSIAITVREESGEEHRMCRWTNVLPQFIKNIRMLNKDSDHLKKYLKTWQDMREDFNRNKKNKNFEQNMTPVYAPYPFLAPHGYGLVIVDMQKNYILDYQGYSSLNTINSIAISNEMNCVSQGVHIINIGRDQPKILKKKAFYLSDDSSNAVLFRELFEAEKITKAKNEQKEKTISLKGKSIEDVIKVIENDKEWQIYFPIDLSPYKVIKYYEHDPKEAMKMRSKIQEIGFKLSNKEEYIWNKWIKERSE